MSDEERLNLIDGIKRFTEVLKAQNKQTPKEDTDYKEYSTEQLYKIFAELQIEISQSNTVDSFAYGGNYTIFNIKTQNYLFVSDAMQGKDRIIQAKNELDDRCFFNIITTANGYLIKSLKFDGFLFVTSQFSIMGDHVVEMGNFVKKKNYFRVEKQKEGYLICNNLSGEYLFVSRDKRFGGVIVEARKKIQKRSYFKIEKRLF